MVWSAAAETKRGTDRWIAEKKPPDLRTYNGASNITSRASRPQAPWGLKSTKAVDALGRHKSRNAQGRRHAR